MTPRHRYGVHGQSMVWIDEDAGQAGGSLREAVGRVKVSYTTTVEQRCSGETRGL